MDAQIEMCGSAQPLYTQPIKIGGRQATALWISPHRGAVFGFPCITIRGTFNLTENLLF
jgi:hypothetical protein